MNNQYSVREKSDRHLQLWLYLLPIVGVIPSIWTLYRDKGRVEQQKASRLSITLALTWIGLYVLLSLSAERASEILAFRLLYTNALLTTGYFLSCTIWMLGLKKGNLPQIPKVSKFTYGDRASRNAKRDLS